MSAPDAVWRANAREAKRLEDLALRRRIDGGSYESAEEAARVLRRVVAMQRAAEARQGALALEVKP